MLSDHKVSNTLITGGEDGQMLEAAISVLSRSKDAWLLKEAIPIDIEGRETVRGLLREG